MSVAPEEVLALLEKRPENWKTEMLSLYDQGASDREVMRFLDLTPDQWQTLEQGPLNTGFGEAVALGRVMRHAWWEAQGRKNLFNPKFNTNLYKTMMANNFAWSDKTETSMTQLDFSNADSDSLVRKIKQLMKQMDVSGLEKITL
jgi:hypothetical protein